MPIACTATRSVRTQSVLLLVIVILGTLNTEFCNASATSQSANIREAKSDLVEQTRLQHVQSLANGTVTHSMRFKTVRSVPNSCSEIRVINPLLKREVTYSLDELAKYGPFSVTGSYGTYYVTTYQMVFDICTNLQTTCDVGYPVGTCAVCQTNVNSDIKYCAGVYSAPDFEPSATGVVLRYANGEASGDTPRVTELQIECDPLVTGAPTDFEFLNAGTSTMPYIITFSHVAACPITDDMVPTAAAKSTGLSVGSVMLIILSVTLVVYVVGGVLINRFVRQVREFPEILPNYAFWASLPGLMRDGALFVWSKIRRRPYEPYQPIPDESV